MWCPHCESVETRERRERTELRCRRFQCHTCKREFNERTVTCFNRICQNTPQKFTQPLWIEDSEVL
jgi:transposase-like protein